MKNLLTRAVLGAPLMLAFTLAAQPMPGGGAGSAFNASLVKMFGDTKAFSAQAEAQMQDKTGNDTMTMPMDFALLNGRMRMELDLTQMKSKQMPAEAMAGMKQMGLDKMINVVAPEKNQMLLIYPTLKAYAEMPLPQEEGTAPTGTDVKLVKTALGKETVDGHPCVKNKIVLTDSKGKTFEGTVWNATDLKDFPVKMEFREKDSTVTMVYRNIKLAAPDEKLFGPPAGFTKYNDIQQIMQAAMQRMTAPAGTQ